MNTEKETLKETLEKFGYNLIPKCSKPKCPYHEYDRHTNLCWTHFKLL